jgi:hypothetical protein
MESNHHRAVKSRMLTVRAMNPIWSPMSDSNGLIASTNRAHHRQCLRGEMEPSRRLARRIAIYACRANLVPEGGFEPPASALPKRRTSQHASPAKWPPRSELNTRTQPSEGRRRSPSAWRELASMAGVEPARSTFVASSPNSLGPSRC